MVGRTIKLRNELFEKKQIRTENGDSIFLNYNLISIDITDENEKVTTAYGIEIEKYKDLNFKEKDFIYAISNEKQKVIQILKQLSKGTVTPMNLATVVDELMT